MVAGNFIDSHIPNWQLTPTDKHQISLSGTIVYKLDITRKDFESALRRLERRQRAVVTKLHQRAPKTKHLSIIDAATVESAREEVCAELGQNYLDQFLYDTESLILTEMKTVYQRAHEIGVRIKPSHASKIINVSPGRSFYNQTALEAHNHRRGHDWVPVVRLDLAVDLDGRRADIEALVGLIRSAMLCCGPLTSFTESASPLDFSAEDTTYVTVIERKAP